MSLQYSDLGDTLAHKCSNPVFSAPLAGVNSQYVLRQDWQQPLANYTPLALNTAHPDYGTYYLVSEDNFQDLGGGQTRFTRTYAQVPSQYIEYGNYAYNYIGFLPVSIYAGLFQIASDGRERFTDNSRAKFVTDFYMVGSGGSYADANLIPEITLTIYRIGDTFGSTTNQYAFTDFLTYAALVATPTVPSREDYELLVTADAADLTSFSITAENSRLTRWMGNIWKREARYVKAL